MTPLHIELMIHYYAHCEPTYNPEAPAVKEYTLDLLKEGLIDESATSGSGYVSTDKGKAFVEKICETPIPVQTWI